MEPENTIKSIPSSEGYDEKNSGTISIKFMRIMPSFKIIDKEVPISFFFDTLYKVKQDYKTNGILVSMNENNLRIKDYFLFVKTLFRNQKLEVIDQQRGFEKGTPDFKIIFEEGMEFFIEFKSKSDSVRPDQLQWMGNNPEKEVWFLILEGIDTDLESDGENYRRFHLENSRQELVNRISNDICSNVLNNVQNIKTKITEEESGR